MNLRQLFQKDQPFHGVKGLVFFDAGNVLIYERDGKTNSYPHYLDLPGGGSEPGESPFETFSRELGEEFGLRINSKNVTYAALYPALKDRAQVSWFIVVRIDPSKKQQIRFGSEGKQYMIMPLQQYLEGRSIPYHVQHVQDYLEWLKTE